MTPDETPGTRRDSEDGRAPALDAPPRPPEVPRRLRIAPAQWIGVPLILAFPILAILGAFGGTGAVVRSQGAIEMRIVYPARARYDMVTSMAVSVRNRSVRSLDTVRVAFDSSYIARFSQVSFIPGADRAFVVSLTDMAPGEARLISVEMSGDSYGPFSGRVTAAAAGDSISAPVRTFTFP